MWAGLSPAEALPCGMWACGKVLAPRTGREGPHVAPLVLESVEDPGSDHDPANHVGAAASSTDMSGSGSGIPEAGKASETSLSRLLTDKGTEAKGAEAEAGGLAIEYSKSA